MAFTLSNRTTSFIVKSVPGMTTDLTIKYFSFAPLNVLSSVFVYSTERFISLVSQNVHTGTAVNRQSITIFKI